MGIRTKLIAAAMAAAMLTVAGAASVSAVPASPTASAPSSDKKDKKDDILAKVAASLHVSVKQLVTALEQLKQALAKGVDKAKAVAAFAKELGVTVADAEKALQALSADKGDKGKPGKGKHPGVPEEAIKLLAAELHISVNQARQVFKDLEKVNGKGEGVVKDPAFVAIAKRLGVTPQRLLDALIKVKQELAGKEKEKEKKVPSDSPAK